jgi:hypothetical protein
MMPERKWSNLSRADLTREIIILCIVLGLFKPAITKKSLVTILLLLAVICQHTLPLLGQDEPLSNEIVLFGAIVLMISGFGCTSKSISFAGTYSVFSKFDYGTIKNDLHRQVVRACVGVGIWFCIWFSYQRGWFDGEPFKSIRKEYNRRTSWMWVSKQKKRKLDVSSML